MWHRREITMATMDHAWCDKSRSNKLNFYDYLQSKLSFEFIEIQQIFVEI